MGSIARFDRVVLGVLLLVGGAVAACSSSASDAPSVGPSAGDDGGAVSLDGATAEAGAASTCVPQPGPDVPDDNFTDTNCDGIDGDVNHAIFVAPTGSDTAAGSITAPVKTLGKAIILANAAQKDVYVCNATYAENVVLDHTSTNIYGGYDCQHAWQRIDDRATVAPATGLALTVRAVTTADAIDRIAFTASDATDPGASSIAALVVNTQNLSIHHTAITSGQGADGASPAAPMWNTTPATSGAPGTSVPRGTVCLLGSTSNPAVCNSFPAGGATPASIAPAEGAGGYGGNGQNLNAVAPPGEHQLGLPGGPAATGGSSTVCGAGAPGQAGTKGADGVGGGGLGSLDANGYHADNGGTDGSPGTTGGGGQGGCGAVLIAPCRDLCAEGSAYYVGGGGGQGGFGGAGGAAAAGSSAGGASIGLILFNSSVDLQNSTFSTGAGGSGGPAVPGAEGQPEGAGGAGGTGNDPSTTSSGAGGDGARGGAGGAGGPGGGGPSIAILTTGASPDVTTLAFNVGSGGSGGHGLTNSDGTDGVTGQVVTLSPSDGGASSDAAAD